MVTRRVVTIDCDYLLPRFAAAYLVVEGNRAAFVDNNTSKSVPLLLAALAREGLAPRDVELLVVTHVHLDHAGGTGALLAACPNATVVAHPRAARHLIDPARLEASARGVYGDDAFESMYGSLAPIPAARVRVVEDGDTVAFGEGRPFEVLHTRGHANHHLCLREPETNAVFTGDAFGLAYPAVQGHGLCVLPTTSPTDFDGEAALATVDRLEALRPARVYPTHFGPVAEVAHAARQLRAHLAAARDEVAALTAPGAPPEEDLEARLLRFWEERLEWAGRERGHPLEAAEREVLSGDVMLNAQGLLHAVRRAQKADPAGKTP